MSEKMIDEFHDYTHSNQFKKDVHNSDFQFIIRHLADLTSGLQNITSNELSCGIYDFDRAKQIHKAEDILSLIKSMNVVRS